MFADEMRPGRTFWRDDVFDITQTADGPFYNVPGYLDNFKVRLGGPKPAIVLGRDCHLQLQALQPCPNRLAYLHTSL